METKNTLIRGAEDVTKVNPLIIEAMDRLTPEDKVNIYYTGGLKEKEPKLITDIDKFIGVATNVHKDADGNYVCDCCINEYLVASANFDNVIDNMMVSVRPLDPKQLNSELVPTVEQFVVYDLDMKHQFDAFMEQEAKKTPLEGDVPFPRVGDNPLKDKDFQEELHEIVEQLKEEANESN